MLGPALVGMFKMVLEGERVRKAAEFAADAKSCTVEENKADSKELWKDPILLSLGVKLEADIQSQ